MRRLRHTVVALAMTLASVLVAAGSPSATAADPPYTITTLHFKVTVGPDDDQSCDIVGDLYQPRDASAANRMPAVLSTNGFGGSKDDQDAISAFFASRGYVALTYSGLGFGGSSCEITLDHPDWDGKAASQLIDFLGGADGIAFTDDAHTQPVAPLQTVQLDGTTDPRVGMVGGSYGGQVQYAAASVTPKLDTIVPIITWNDLSYSLAPNNTDQIRLPGQELIGVSTETPGAVKMNWALAFSALGALGDAQNQQPDNPISSRCPNFAAFVCPALVYGAATGTMDDNSVRHLRQASVATYQDKVKVPTLILQGQADTLFNLNEAVATYQALQAQGTPVKMSWIEYGHSGGPAPGELDFSNPSEATQHVTKRIDDWFAHYLKGQSTAPTGPEFSWFRDWVDYSGTATPAYAESSTYPVGTRSTYHLSSTPTSTLTGGALVTSRQRVTSGNEFFTTPGGGAPASDAEEFDVLSTFFERPEETEVVRDVPGTFARYDTDPLSGQVDVVGSPQVRLQVQAPAAQATQGQDAGKLVLFLKVVDVAPDGTGEVVRNLAAPVRVPDVDQAFTVTMPAFVHRFEKGHRIRLIVAGASPNYRGSNQPVGVGISTTAGDQATRPLPAQSVTLPTLGSVPPSAGGAPSNAGNGPGVGGGGGTGGGTGPSAAPGGGANGPGSGSLNGTDDAVSSPPGSAQAAPAVIDASASTTPLPDTGGPPLGLLGAGLLLVVLGAHQLARRGRSGLR